MSDYFDGQWLAWGEGESGGFTIRLGPVFSGEVYFKDGWWRATLDGQAMGSYGDPAAAKARVDWEMWNRLRQVRKGYGVLLGRKAEWEHGGGGPPPTRR